jgi:hypothetical protein
MYKEIRIVCRKGRYSIQTVVFDSDGEVIRIVADDVDVWSKDLTAFKKILDAIVEARKLPILHLNASNAHLYGVMDLDVGED